MNAYTVLGASSSGDFDIMRMVSSFFGVPSGSASSGKNDVEQMKQILVQQQAAEELRRAKADAERNKSIAIGVGAVASVGILGLVLWKVLG